MNIQTQEALKMAIEAMKELKYSNCTEIAENKYCEAYQACKEALEQPAMTYEQGFAHGYEAHRVEQTLEQPAQEPVAWIKQDNYGAPSLVFNGSFKYESSVVLYDNIPLYTHPKDWVGLSYDEIKKIDKSINQDVSIGLGKMLFARAIEQALREKNDVT